MPKSNQGQQMPSFFVDVSLSSSSAQVLRILHGAALLAEVASKNFQMNSGTGGRTYVRTYVRTDGRTAHNR